MGTNELNHSANDGEVDIAIETGIDIDHIATRVAGIVGPAAKRKLRRAVSLAQYLKHAAGAFAARKRLCVAVDVSHRDIIGGGLAPASSRRSLVRLTLRTFGVDHTHEVGRCRLRQLHRGRWCLRERDALRRLAGGGKHRRRRNARGRARARRLFW